MKRLLAFLLLSTTVTWVITYYARLDVFAFYDELLSSFYLVVITMSALSYPLYGYVDNVAKDVSQAIDSGADSAKLFTFSDLMDDLKKEVVKNAFLVLFMFIGQLLLSAVHRAFIPELKIAAYSLSVSFYLVSILTLIVQGRGFFLAAGLRGQLIRGARRGNSNGKNGAS